MVSAILSARHAIRALPQLENFVIWKRWGRRVVRRYSAGDRDRLIREYHASGQTKKDFCDGRGVNLGTFHGWFKKPENAKPKLAEVEVGRSGAPIEIELPDGRRIGLHLNGESVELAKLIRGVLQC